MAKALGINIVTVNEWLREKYGSTGNNLYEAIQNTNAYADVYAPTSIYSRYVFEDIPTGLIPLFCLGKKLGVDTPIAKAVIDWATALYSFDFLGRSRNETKMDLDAIIRSIG